MSYISQLTTFVILSIYVANLCFATSSSKIFTSLKLVPTIVLPIWRIFFAIIGVILLTAIFGYFYWSEKITGYLIIGIFALFIASIAYNNLVACIKVFRTKYFFDFLIQTISFIFFLILIALSIFNNENGLLFFHTPLLSIFNIAYLIVLLCSTFYSAIMGFLYVVNFYPKNTPRESFQIIVITSLVTIILFILATINPVYVEYDYAIYSNLLSIFGIGYTTFLIPYVAYRYSKNNRKNEIKYLLIKPNNFPKEKTEAIISVISSNNFELSSLKNYLHTLNIDCEIEFIANKSYKITIKNKR